MKRKSKLKVGHSREEELRILERRAQVSRLSGAGMPRYKIAEKLGLNKGQITRDIQAVEHEWMDSAVMDIAKRKARELAKVDHLETMYREAWERSCQDSTVSTQKQVGKGGEARLEVTIRKVGQSGNPAFLAGIMSCITKRCEIIEGLKATNRHELTSPELDAQIAGLLTDLERRSEAKALLKFREEANGIGPSGGAAQIGENPLESSAGQARPGETLEATVEEAG
jgi:hypothetical protein